MSNEKSGVWGVGALLGGFILSVLALGVLWAGTPWPYQFLMAVPFSLAAFAFGRFGRTAYPMLMGIAPVSALFVQFRDREGSHLLPILLVGTWMLAILLGQWLATRIPRRQGSAADNR